MVPTNSWLGRRWAAAAVGSGRFLDARWRAFPASDSATRAVRGNIRDAEISLVRQGARDVGGDVIRERLAVKTEVPAISEHRVCPGEIE